MTVVQTRCSEVRLEELVRTWIHVEGRAEEISDQLELQSERKKGGKYKPKCATRMELYQLGDEKAVGDRFVGKIRFYCVHGNCEMLSGQPDPQVWG